MKAYAVEESISECLELNDLLRHSWKTVFDQLFDGEIEDIDGYNPVIIEAVERSINTATRARAMATRALGRGFDVDGFSRIDKMIPELKELRLEIERKWPKIDPRMMASNS